MVAVAGTGWVLAPSLVAYVLEADRYYPQRDRSADGSIGDLAHQARVSDHNPDDGYVHAVDLDEDLAPGLDLKGFAERLRLRRDPRVKYVIYEGRMFSSYATVARKAWAWGPYTGTNGHFHHMHLSILHTDAARTNLDRWGFAPLVETKAPAEETDMLIVAASGKPTRLLAPPAFVPIGSSTAKSLTAAGVKTVTLTGAEYDSLRGQIQRALDE